MSHVGSLENHRLRSKFVQVRRVNFCASIASDGIRSLLVRQKNDQVRFSRKFGWLRHHWS